MTEQKTRLAFEILARENSRMLMVYLRSLIRDEAIIDDLFQESMIVAWQKVDECDRERPFGPWLRGIASRIVMAHYRKQKTIPLAMQESVLSVVDRHFEAINMLAGDTWDDKLAALHECVDALPVHQMDVIRGRYFDRHKGPHDKRHYHAAATFQFVTLRKTETEHYTPQQRGGGEGRRDAGATKAFAGYDTDNDGQLTQSELSGRGGSRSAMAGFLKGHAKEIDRDSDGIVSKKEAISNAERMFQKIDTSGDGEIQPDELEASRRK